MYREIAFMAQRSCAGITQGAVYDCDNPIQPGVNEKRLILVNIDDIASVTFDLTDTTTITDITLVTGKQGWAFEGFRNSLNPQYNLIPQTVSIGYDHQVDFTVFDISQAQKDNLQALAASKVVAVVENAQGQGQGNNFFEVYGLQAGMEPQTLTRIVNDVETAGAFTVSLITSPDGAKESKMPVTWFDTDYATTKAKVDALLVPAGP